MTRTKGLISDQSRPNPVPRISIIIPVFNAEKHIGATIKSIQAQTFTDFDVHLVDDCSTDTSLEVMERLCSSDGRFQIHRVASNFGGPAGPRNLGVANSNGELIAFCDADDLWASHKLETQLKVMDAFGADIVSAKVRDFRDGEEPAPLMPPTANISTTRIGHKRLMLKNWLPLSSVMVRRASMASIGLFNEARSYVAVEDYDLWLRAASAGAIIYRMNTPLVHYRRVETQISRDKSMMIRKALRVIGDDYRRRGLGFLFSLARPLHWVLYITTSAWMRLVKREL